MYSPGMLTFFFNVINGDEVYHMFLAHKIVLQCVAPKKVIILKTGGDKAGVYLLSAFSAPFL